MSNDKPSTETQVQGDLEIDETRLPEELQRHAARFFFYGVAWCSAIRKAKVYKSRAKEVEARLTKSFRQEMLDVGLKLREVTLKMIDDFLAENSEMKEANEELIQAEYTADMLGVAKDAFRDRGRMLGDLSRIKGEVGYFAEREGYTEMQRQLEERRGKPQPKEEKAT